jgi:hypothetical protein
MIRSLLRSWKRFFLRHLGIARLQDGQDDLRQEIGKLSSRIAAGDDGRAASLNAWIDLEKQLRTLLADQSPQEIKATVLELVDAKTRGCALVLDYPPSYDYRPRWGYSRPPHAGLSALFDRDSDVQNELLQQMLALKPFLDRIPFQFDHEGSCEPGWMGGPINAVDTATLYSFLVKHRPKTYLEIGSGVTTLFAARAKRDHQLPTRIISIDPNPRAAVDARCDEVLRKPFEMSDLDVFERLQPGDIVFMDGSHRTFMNSDVTVFMLDVLPKLAPGVIVHFHDIVLPHDYAPMFADWYWNEQYILGAYLLGAADRVRILMPTGHFFAKKEVQRALAPLVADWKGPATVWQYGGSLWFTHK